MLRRCCVRLLHVLGPSSPLLTRLPLLCPRSLMKPLVVFVLGGPGAGKGTQCARIVEVRPGQRRAPGDCGDAVRAPRSRPWTTRPGGHRAARVAAARGAGAWCAVLPRGPPGELIPAPPFPCVWGTRCVSQVGGEKVRRGGQCAAGVCGG